MTKFGKAKHIHFVGVGGIGMSGIAELLLNLGYEVSGSDLKSTSITRRLCSLGGKIFEEGHKREQVEGADVVVYSSAVAMDNPELQEARERFIPVIPRAEMLSELMRLKFGVAVAGSHGKTTTTCMVGSILTSGNLDPTVVIGGRLDIWGGSNAKLGLGDFMVAESDESDGSFLALSPTIAVVTNIDQEHMDFYKNMDALRNTFIGFINKVPFYGLAILCLDDKEIQHIIPRLKKPYQTYGLSAQADLRATDIETGETEVSFEAVRRDKSLGRIRVGMPGNHNVLNALAAISVGMELQIPMEEIKKGLLNLGGLARRLQIKGEEQGILVMDDYGHHPTEISATLETIKACRPDRRLIVAFQPHRYSRTKSLYDRFVVSFNHADTLILSPVYPAGEAPLPGVDAEWLYRGIKEHGHKDVLLAGDKGDLLDLVLERAAQGDVVLTLGAGDIYTIGEEFLEILRGGGRGG